MHQLRSLIRNFFGFNRSQTNAFLILLPLMALIIFSQPLYRYWVSHSEHVNPSDKAMLDSLVALWEADTITLPSVPGSSWFTFNPNDASKDELLSLGFSEGVSKRILNYRQKGGKFLVKKDLLKIYGLDSGLYNQLYGFIELPEAIEKKKHHETIRKEFEKTSPTKLLKFDLNTADTAQLKKVYGIGEKLSARIIKYRERLGGFINYNQLSEVYGLDSTVIHRLENISFIEENFRPVSIDINTANVDQLSFHPYIKKSVAEAIVAYRFQHGNFKSLQDIARIKILDITTLQKIVPYVKIGE